MHCSGWTRKLSLWEGDDRDHEASHVGFEHSKDETGGAKIAQTGSGAVGCWQFSENCLPFITTPQKIHPEMAGGRRASFFFPHLDPKGVVTQSYGPVVHLVGEA